jgi:hypothetical protein
MKTSKKKMPGITKLIPQVFCPGFKFKHLVHKPQNPGGLKKRAAKRRGNRLDNELSDNRRLSQFEDDCVISNNIIIKECKETKLIRKTLEEMNLEIEDTQVFAQEENVKTFLDLIVKHKETGKKYVVELKRGCEYRRCGTKNGKLLFQTTLTLSDALLYQHQLQVLIGRWLYKHEHDYGVLLIYVNETKVEVLEESDMEAKLLESGKLALLKAANKKQKLRSKRRKLN